MSRIKDVLMEKKRLGLMIVGGLILIVVIAVIIKGSEPKPLKKPKQVFKTNINNKNLLYKEWMTKNGDTVSKQGQELAKLKKMLTAMQKAKNKPTGHVFGKPAGNAPTGVYPPAPVFGGRGATHSVYKYSSVKNVIQQESYKVPVNGKPAEIHSPHGKPAQRPAPANNSPSKKKKQEHNFILPGSFVKGVLITGADVPTGTGGQTGPLPVIIRLTGLAQLPNLYKTDIKSCFVVGQATGVLSAERAYIKVNHLSCVTKTGSPISQPIAGTVFGIDGVEGLSGKVVSKQGAMLARTLVAGFLQGVGNAFQQSQTNISVSPLTGGTTQAPITPNLHTLLSYGIGGGVSRATQELAQFYMAMAKQMFPVIVIHAGRPVDIAFLKEVKIK